MTTAQDNLDWIHGRWTYLTVARLKGTHRPWREPTLTAEQRAQLDAQARAEKQERGAFVLGESPAPVHLDTLDKLQDIAHKLRRLALAVDLETGIVTPALHAQTDYRNVPAIIDYLQHQLPHTSEAAQDTARRVTARIRADMAHDFAEVFDGKRLKADCPWCRQPALYIRLIGPEHARSPVIACQSGTCEPPAADCGTWWRGRPAWPAHEWDWLARRLNHSSAPTSNLNENQQPK